MVRIERDVYTVHDGWHIVCSTNRSHDYFLKIKKKNPNVPHHVFLNCQSLCSNPSLQTPSPGLSSQKQPAASHRFFRSLKGLIFSPTKLSLPQTTNSISYEKLSQRLKMLGQQVFCDTGPGSFCSQGLSSYL